jgi:hypothetical protein
MVSPSLRRIRPAAVGLAVLLGLAAPRASAAPGDGAPRRAVAFVQVEAVPAVARPGEAVEVTVLLYDGRGDPVDDPGVVLGSVAGDVGPLVRIREGVLRATFTAPRSVPRARAAVLFATTSGEATEHVLPLVSGPASRLEISGPDAVTDPAAHVYLSVSVVDAFGNPADDEARARSAAGSLPVRRIGPGVWMVDYRPASDAEEADDAVSVEAGSARGSHSVRLTRSARWVAVAPWAGAVLGGASGVAAGATASAWWRSGPDHLGLLLDLGWWRLRDEGAVGLPGGSVVVTGERTYVPVTAALAWSHLLGSRLNTMVGAGAGGALVVTSERLAGQPAVDEAGWAPAATLSAGLGYRAGRGLAFLEARGAWIGDAGLSTLSGSTRALLLLAGYRYDAR